MEYSALRCGTNKIKGPFNWRFITVKQAIEYPNILRFDEENHQYYMNERHDYFYQVQLQMYTFSNVIEVWRTTGEGDITIIRMVSNFEFSIFAQ
jgi:hypothetical protein